MIRHLTNGQWGRACLGILCLAMVAPGVAAWGQAVPGGRNIIQNGLFADDPQRPVHWVTRDSGNLGTFTLTPPAKGERSGVLSVEVRRESSQPWTLELRQKLEPALSSGETLYITFEYKISEGYAFHFYWQKDSSPWPKFLALRINEPVNAWHKCMVAIPIHEELAERQTSLSFHLAERVGTVQFRNVAAIVLPRGRDTRDLETNVEPVFGGDYYDNDWRRQTQERLDKVRKADLLVQVNRNGKAAPRTPIKIRQQDRPFSFGTCVQAPLLVEDDLDARPFARLVRSLGEHRSQIPKFKNTITDRRLFDTVMFAEALTWRDSVEWGNDIAPKAIEEMKAHGLAFRGFALYIPAFLYAPPRCRQMASDELMVALETFVRRQTQRYRGKVDQWCVLYGALTYEEIYDIIGVDSLVKVFRLAKQGDPDAALLLGDDKALLLPSEGHLRETLELVNWLRAEGAPIDGLMLNARLTRPYIAPQAMETRLNMIAQAIDLPVHVTNLEVEAAKEEIQANMLQDLLLLFYSHPAVSSVSFSGIWEAAALNGKSSLFRRNMAVKPAGKMLQNLLTEEWLTSTEAETGEDGSATVRGFHGTYTVTVGEGEAATSESVVLGAEGAKVVIDLP